MSSRLAQRVVPIQRFLRIVLLAYRLHSKQTITSRAFAPVTQQNCDLSYQLRIESWKSCEGEEIVESRTFGTLPTWNSRTDKPVRVNRSRASKEIDRLMREIPLEVLLKSRVFKCRISSDSGSFARDLITAEWREKLQTEWKF